MLHKNIKIIVALILIALSIKPAFASNIQIEPLSSMHVDTTLLDSSKFQFQQINKVNIFDLTTTDQTIGLSTKDYVEGLRFYLESTYNEDIPFTYLVGWDGKIYEGSSLGEASFPGNGGSLTIAYLDSGEGLTDAGFASLSYLLTQVASKTGLGLSTISPAGYSYSDGAFSLTESQSPWTGSINNIKSSLKGVIPDTNVTSTNIVSINSVSISQTENSYDVSVSFTNTSHTSLYGRIYGGDDNASTLYIPGIWISTSRANANLIPTIDAGQKGVVDIKVALGLKPGKYHLALYTDSTKIAGSDFFIQMDSSSQSPTAVTVTPTPLKVVTIGSTGLGYLNVHANPSITAPVIAKVLTGKTYSVLQSQNGWDEINYDGSHNGWIDGEYTK